MNYKGTQYAADMGYKGTKYAADKNYDASKYAANKNYAGALAQANATRAAARSTASTSGLNDKGIDYEGIIAKHTDKNGNIRWDLVKGDLMGHQISAAEADNLIKDTRARTEKEARNNRIASQGTPSWRQPTPTTKSITQAVQQSRNPAIKGVWVK